MRNMFSVHLIYSQFISNRVVIQLSRMNKWILYQTFVLFKKDTLYIIFIVSIKAINVERTYLETEEISV